MSGIERVPRTRTSKTVLRIRIERRQVENFSVSDHSVSRTGCHESTYLSKDALAFHGPSLNIRNTFRSFDLFSPSCTRVRCLGKHTCRQHSTTENNDPTPPSHRPQPLLRPHSHSQPALTHPIEWNPVRLYSTLRVSYIHITVVQTVPKYLRPLSTNDCERPPAGSHANRFI